MGFAALSLPVLDCLGYVGLVGYGDALGCNGVGCDPLVWAAICSAVVSWALLG